MAKKTSLKSQIYQQIANKQVQQVMNSQREQGIQQLQADFNAWQTRQNEIAQLQAEFDAWNEQNKPATPTVETSRQTIPSIADLQPAVHEQTEMEKHIAEVTKQAKEKRLRERAQKLQQLEQIEAAQPYNPKERETLASIDDISKKLTNVIPETEALGTVTKTWKRGQRPEATDTSSQVAARPTHEKIDTSNVPVDVDRWLSPETKLTDAEKLKAKEYASAELQKIKYGPNKMPMFENEEQRQHYSDMVNLINKSNRLTNTLSGALEIPYNLADTVSDGARSVGNQLGGLGAAITDKLGVTEGATKRHNEQAEIANQFADQNEANMRQNFKNAQTQNPVGYTAGKIAGQMGMYMLTNPVFDGIAAGAGVESELAKFFINQGAQNVQDLVLDTAPTVKQLMQDNATPEDVKREMLSNILWNAAGNLVMGGAGELLKNRAVKKASDEAFRDNVRAGADNLSQIANEQLPVMSDVDNVVGSTIRQTEGLARNSESILNQAPIIEPEKVMQPKSNAEFAKYIKEGQEKLHRANMVGEAANKEGYRRFGNFQEVDINDFINDDGKISQKILSHPEIKTSSDAPRKSIDQIEAESSNLMEEIYRFRNKKMGKAEVFHIGEPSEILKEFGFGDKPLYMTQEDMRKVLAIPGTEKVRHPHYVGTGAFEALSEKLDDPIAIIKNKSKKNVDTYVVLTDIANLEGDPGLIALKVYNNGKIVVEDKMTSMYGKGKIKDYLSRQIGEGNVLYFKQTKSAPDEALRSFQSAPGSSNAPNVGSVDQAVPSDLNITDAIENVNKNSVNNVSGVKKSLADSPEMSKNAEEMATYVYDTISRDVNKIYDSGNEALKSKFDELTSYYENYARVITQSNDMDEINDATRELKNAISRFDTVAKKVDLSLSKPFNNRSFTNQLDDFNTQLDNFYNAERKSQEAFDAINELENGNPNKVMAEEIGISKQPKSDIITSEPIEPGKYEIPDTPENAPIDVPPVDGMKERGTSKHIRNAGTPMKMEGVADEVVADFEDNPDMYKVLKNADTKAKAEKIYAEADNPEIEFRDMLRRHDPAALPLGHQLAKDYSAAGNHEAAAQIYREMGEQLTKSGQFSQAAAISMMKNDPLTALNYAERQIDKLNENGAKQFGNKWKDFSLTDDEIKMFNNIAPGDEEAIKAAYDAIGARLGKEYPTTFMDKLLEGRKIAMLFNVRTNIRNVGANIPTLGLRWASDRVEAIGQNIAHLINPEIKVTQAVTGSGRQGRKLATEVFNSKEVQAMLKNQGGKYEIPELRNSLVQNKQMYKGTALSKWIDRVTDGGIQKVNEKLFGRKGVQSGLETIRNATYKMLDLGDSPFVKENFVERLGSYIHAQGIKDIKDIPEEAIQTAYEEAMKATYKDNSWAVQMLSGLKGGIEKIPGVGKPLSQAAIPFLQAPGNIAARMIDYSPVKATKGIVDIISGARANNVKKVSKGIEEAAKGLTGSGLILLGMRLRDSGIITGTYSDDKDQKAYEKQTGFKEFALHVGDKYFTYDWAQPFAEPLIIGTLLSDAINKSDEYDSDLLDYFGVDNPIAKKALGVAYEGGKASLNSWFNASPLQGLQELLSGGFNGTDIAQNIVDTGVSDFAGAFVPASVNAVAKSMDTTQRNTYDPSNKVSTFVNQQIAKIPKLSETLPAKYDTWGREMKYADSKAMAAASRFIVPGDYSYDKSDKIDKEIMRLYEGTKGDAAVFPQVAPNKVGDKKLNNKEVSEYQKDMGTRSRQLAEEFINSDVYKDMEDANRVEVLSNMYGASKTITERDKFDKEPAESSRYKRAIEAYDKAGGGEKGVKAMVDYYTAKSVSDEAGLDADSNAAKAIQKDVQDGNMEAAQQKKDAAQQLPTLGLDKPGPTYTYYNAQKNIPNLTVEEFAKTYKSIDSNSNQGIAQDEIINYLNKQHISSESEAKKIWNAYGKSDWKSIPSLQDGTWKKKKK